MRGTMGCSIFYFMSLPNLRNHKFQHTSCDTARFIGDKKAVFKFRFSWVDICYLEAGCDRVAAAEQAAQDAGDLGRDRKKLTARCADLGDGLPCLDDIADGM